MKKDKPKKSAFKWGPICLLAEKAMISEEECYDFWELILARIDEYSRIESSKKWHKENDTMALRFSIETYTQMMDSAIAALKSGDCDDWISDCGGDEIPLDAILKCSLLIKYRAAELPSCDPEVFLNAGEEDDEEAYANAEELAAEERYATNVPEIPYDELKRLSSVKSAKELLDDKSFLALAKEVLSAERCEITSKGTMRLHEYDLHEKMMEKMATLCGLSAIRAKDVGDEALARRFVEAAHRLRYRIRHWWHGEMSDAHAQYVAETILKSFDELQRAIAVRRLPKWKKGR